MKCKPDGRKRVGRPKLHWMDDVMDDIRILGIRNWWTAAKVRDLRRETKVHSGL